MKQLNFCMRCFAAVLLCTVFLLLLSACSVFRSLSTAKVEDGSVFTFSAKYTDAELLTEVAEGRENMYISMGENDITREFLLNYHKTTKNAKGELEQEEIALKDTMTCKDGKIIWNHYTPVLGEGDLADYYVDAVVTDIMFATYEGKKITVDPNFNQFTCEEARVNKDGELELTINVLTVRATVHFTGSAK